MRDEIHGHEVMQMMIEAKKGYSKESLRADVLDRFGEDTRFYTCSQSGMTIDELIEFLAVRGKFVSSDEGFTTDPGKICQH